MWVWLKQVVASIWMVIAYKVSIPVWLLVFGSIPLVSWLVRTTKKVMYSSVTTAQKIDEEAKESELHLTTDELSVMKIFIAADGNSLQVDDIKYRLHFSVLKIQQIVEALEEKQLIGVSNNYLHGTRFYISRKGRDFMLGNSYTNT